MSDKFAETLYKYYKGCKTTGRPEEQDFFDLHQAYVSGKNISEDLWLFLKRLSFNEDVVLELIDALVETAQIRATLPELQARLRRHNSDCGEATN